jgi:hypothetical protein
MLTIFAIPKAFRGHIAVIQRNAIYSWKLLNPACEIILFGDDEGTAEIAAELGVRHIPDVARNEYGTPLVSDIFEQAQRCGAHDLLCYVNADIILMSDFLRGVEQVAHRKRPFLMIGQRWDVNIDEQLDFGPRWEERLRAYLAEHGQSHAYTGIDYFVFRRGLWKEIPPFAIGRTVWDNWLLYGARQAKAFLIDATLVITAVHQNHNISTIHWEGPEAKRNLELAGGSENIFTLQDATHLLTQQGLKRPTDNWHMERFLNTLPRFYPYLSWPTQILLKIIEVSSPLRHSLGLILPRKIISY